MLWASKRPRNRRSLPETGRERRKVKLGPPAATIADQQAESVRQQETEPRRLGSVLCWRVSFVVSIDKRGLNGHCVVIETDTQKAV